VEHQVVERNGGRIELFPVLAGMSSSHTLSRLPSAERVHAGFTLTDVLSRERLPSTEVVRRGIVLSADSRLLRHGVKIVQDKPLLTAEDVTNRWGLNMKVATG
jgi:hypothetical protein